MCMVMYGMRACGLDGVNSAGVTLLIESVLR